MAKSKKKNAPKKTTTKVAKIAKQVTKRVLFNVAETKYREGVLGVVNALETPGPTTVNPNNTASGAITNSSWDIVAVPVYFITQGTAQNNRLGDQIHITSFEFSMYVYPNNGVATNIPVDGISLRCELWHDTQCNGALAASTNVYSTTANNGFDRTFNSLYNPDRLPRFKLVHSMKHSIVTYLNGATPVGSVDTSPVTRFTIPINQTVKFSANGGAQADLLKHNWFFAFTSIPTGALSVRINYRVRFKDS